MARNSDHGGDKSKPDEKASPAEMPFVAIVRSLTTSQFYGIVVTLLSLLGAGYGVGQWTSSTGHQRELMGQEETHRTAISERDGIIAQRDYAISNLEGDLKTARVNGEEALKVAAGANRSARAFRAKAEFLNRYLSYLEDPDPSGTMRKLFADHVCVLWKKTQKDILSVNSDSITLQQVSRGSALTPAAIKALAAAGLDQPTMEEYLQLNRRRSQIQPQTTPQVEKLLGLRANFRRLQQLEEHIGAVLQKGVSTKTVTFFDGSQYMIPLPVADDVHRRADCQ